MKREWGLAAIVAVVAVLLAFEGYMALWGVEASNYILSNPGASFSTPDQVDSARSLRPQFYAVAVEGVVFGVLSAVFTLAILRRDKWAHRGLLVASLGLAAMASVIIVLAPHLWDDQGVFIGLCACYWWVWYAKHRDASAL